VTERLRRALPVAAALAVFLGALEVLRLELRAVSWHALRADVLATSPSRLALALALTGLNYLVLTGYDLIAFAYIGKALSRWRIAAASLLAYAVSNNVGFAMLSGASVRYRFYTRWGVTPGELTRIVFSYSVTFWLGLLALGGLSLATSPLPEAHGVPGGPVVRIAGVLMMTAVASYLVATVVRRSPLRRMQGTILRNTGDNRTCQNSCHMLSVQSQATRPGIPTG
jgi:phosphatidylglycerol lysyltransferase